MDPTILVTLAVVAAPAVLILATLAMLGAFVATLADGQLSIVRPPQP
jgi:hypothetical protein